MPSSQAPAQLASTPTTGTTSPPRADLLHEELVAAILVQAQADASGPTTASHEPTFGTVEDEDGTLTAIAVIPLRRGEHALCDRADWDRMVADGRAPWHLFSLVRPASRFTVRSASGQSGAPLVAIARIIMGAGPDERVRFDSGNLLDLRRSNLRLEPRWPTRPAASAPVDMPQATAPDPASATPATVPARTMPLLVRPPVALPITPRPNTTTR